jgi:hypothetical protein
MISQRRVVQLGVLSATAVFLTCIGVLVFQNGESSAPQDGRTQSASAEAAQAESNSLSLSSADAPVVHLPSAHR